MGGIKKWCPNCKKYTSTKSLSIPDKRCFMKHAHDIQFFRRKLKCNECYNNWQTDEVQHQFLEELIVLRRLKRSIQQTIKEFNDQTDELLLQKLYQCFARLDQYGDILQKEEVEYDGIRIGSLVVTDLIEEDVKTILLVDDIQESVGKIFLQASQAICKINGKWREIRKLVSRYDGENLNDVRLINDEEFEEWLAFGKKQTQYLKVGIIT